MIKLLYFISLLMLVGAGFVLVSCGALWSQDMTVGRTVGETSIVERFQTLGSHSNKSGGDMVPPLVRQATAYALYLTPPAPKARTAVAASHSTRAVAPAVTVEPKFRLLLTTYYRSDPDRSLALVSEPGRGDHWVKKDERLGRFIVVRVQPDSMVYRDGSRLEEMKVPVRETVQLVKTVHAGPIPAQKIGPGLRSPRTPQSVEVE